MIEGPKTITEALTALRSAQEENARLAADLTAATALLNEQIGRAENIEAQRVELLDAVTALEARNAELNQAAQAAEMRVTEAMAAIGVPPVTVASEPVQQRTQKELWAEYNALPVEARNVFYLKHRDTLRN
jgi:chromosome segregation ATPase